MTYSKEDWNKALDACQMEFDWDEIDIREGVGPIGLAILEAYESDKIGQDMPVLEAALAAAWARYGTEWGVPQFESVWTNYVEGVDGWQAVGEQYLEDQYTGLVATHSSHIDLESIGREYARDRQTEQYITIPDDGKVYIFNKLN